MVDIFTKLFSSSEEPNGLIREDVLLRTNPSWESYFSGVPIGKGKSPGSWRRDYCLGRRPGYGEILKKGISLVHENLRLPLGDNSFLRYNALLDPVRLEDEA